MDIVFTLSSLWWAAFIFVWLRTNSGRAPYERHNERRFMLEQAVIAVIGGLIVEGLFSALTRGAS